MSDTPPKTVPARRNRTLTWRVVAAVLLALLTLTDRIQIWHVLVIAALREFYGLARAAGIQGALK